MSEVLTSRLRFQQGDNGQFLANDDVLRCSFCNKSQGEVAKLIANPSERASRAYICDECIAVCNLVIENSK